jgi:molecular chaperone DnaK (HSP70)
MILIFAVILKISAHVIGIDFGSEFIKIAVIKPGKKLVIVENEDNKRNTFNVFAFNGKETLTSSKGLFKYMKNPENAVKNVKNYLGVDFFSDRVKHLENKTFDFVEKERNSFGGVEFKVFGRNFVAEEVAGIVLQGVKRVVDTFAGSDIRDCVVSIPCSFSRQQKHALIAAVKIAGLNLMDFVYDNSAAALYYSMERVDQDTDHVMMIFNFGSVYTQVSVVSLWGYFENQKYFGNVQPLGHLSTTDFGGYIIDNELCELIIQDFFQKHGIDLHSHPSSLSKLWKEVNSAKSFLITSQKFDLILENLINNLDLNFSLSQEMLNKIILNYKNSFLTLADSLLKELKIPFESIKEIELIGGLSKVTKIQEILENHFKSKVFFHMHPTESVALGAALLAAKEGASVTTGNFKLSEVSSCSISYLTSLEESMIFLKNSQLKSKKTLEIQIPENKSLFLIETCNSALKFYKYTFPEEGTLSLSFTLDSKGFGFLLSARQEGSSLKFTSKDQSIPLPIPEETLEKMIENLSTFQSSIKENEILLKTRNDIESILYFLKDKLQEDDFKQVMNETEEKVLQKYVEETENWLISEDFKTANESQIKEKIWIIRNELVSVLEKENDLKVREKLVMDSRSYLEKLKQFMNMVNETTWIPRKEIEEAWHVLFETEKWLNQKVEDQKTLKNWEIPAINEKDFDNKFLFLRSQLEKFANFKPPDEKKE